MNLSRRQFFGRAAVLTLGFRGLRQLAAQESPPAPNDSVYGPLIPDARQILDLPRGFSYDVISRTGDQMDDGFLVPGAPDGMAAFRGGPGGRTILIRNHELRANAVELGPFGPANERLDRIRAGRMYDRGSGDLTCQGGTTTLVYDTQSKKLATQFLSLAGTIRNCSGGPTPWGTWITCEEDVQKAVSPYTRDHGYCFEVRATTSIGLADPVPFRAMGRFYREAVAVDAETGCVYQTEDRDDSLFYRFIPDRPRDLRSGRLQALKIRGMEQADTSNWERRTVRAGERLSVDWIDITGHEESFEDDLRYKGFEAGATRFCRGEGMWSAPDAIYFMCTSGGPAKGGQVWRYRPRTSTLELFIEPNHREWLDMGDNLTMSPWGDLLICEDGPGGDSIVGVTPHGKLYTFARNALNEAEIAGCVFSPDGSTLFLNLYMPGMTLAITGPWAGRPS